VQSSEPAFGRAAWGSKVWKRIAAP
jgi:hypothetical protein